MSCAIAPTTSAISSSRPSTPTPSQLAETLISKMSGKLDINKFEDGYETAVKALVESKVNNLPIPIDQAPQQRPSNVVNLMDALRKSLGSDSTSTKPGSPATGPSRWGGKKPPRA